MKIYIKKIITNRALQHVLFWLLSWIVFANTFKVSANLQRIDLIYSALFHISIIEAVILNLWILIPQLLNKKKYVLYFLGLSLVILVGIQLNNFTFNYLTDRILNNYYFISYYNFFDLLKFFLVYLSITTLLKLSKSWFKMQELNSKLLLIEQEHIKSELKALKSQINPHFLFNSLNLLYALAIKNSNHTPDAIIQLSDILRYVTYETKQEKITLKNEIKLINNYLDLQKLRVEKDIQIKFTSKVENPDFLIPPMLYLPLIENSFKHGIGRSINNTFVNIKLIGKLNSVRFEIENNLPGDLKEQVQDEEGIGLENIRKRLALVYPEKHTFEVKEESDRFKVILSIYETR